MVGAGSVVTSDVPPHAIMAGTPARILRFRAPPSLCGENLNGVIAENLQEPRVQGVRWVKMTRRGNNKGQSIAGEWKTDWPFNPIHVEFVFNLPDTAIRSHHAYRECHQLLLCLTGGLKILVDNGTIREELLIHHPEHALYVPNGIWTCQYGFQPNTVLAIFASHEFDEADIVRDYRNFLSFHGLST